MTEQKDWRDVWANYHKCTGTLTWRLATLDDLPQILHMRKVMDRFLGQKQDDPLLFSRPILICLVAEDKNGKIVDGIYAETKVEILKMSCTQKGFDETQRLVEDLHPWLKSLGFRFVNVVVSKRIADRMANTLKQSGFSRVKDLFTYWVQRL